MKTTDVNLLREALPYINRFTNKTFVIKFGGEVAEEPEILFAFCEELALLSRVGIKVVVVHGGGKQASEYQKKLGFEPVIVQGRRVTDESALDVVKMVFAGKLNVEILVALRKAGVKCVGLSGVDGDMIHARRRPPQKVLDEQTGRIKEVDFGFVGEITQVDASLIQTLIERDFIPVISSLGSDNEGNLFNINADTVSAAIAGNLHAEKLIVASDVDGIYAADGTIISRLTLSEIDDLVGSGVIKGGMIPKARSCQEAVKGGVKSVHIINGTRKGSLLSEIFTETGCGTMICS